MGVPSKCSSAPTKNVAGPIRGRMKQLFKRRYRLFRERNFLKVSFLLKVPVSKRYLFLKSQSILSGHVIFVQVAVLWQHPVVSLVLIRR